MQFRKINTIFIFLFGVFSLFALIYNSKNITIIAKAESISPSDVTIYDDQLHSGFINWSWNSDVNFNVTNSVYQGSKAISFTPSAWGGFYLHTDTPLDSANFTVLRFSLLLDDPTLPLSLMMYDQNNNSLSAPLPLSKYTDTMTPKQWRQIAIPISDILSSNHLIKGFAIQNSSEKTNQTISIDDIKMIAKQPVPPTPTVTPHPISTNPLSGVQFFNNPDSNPAQSQADAWQASRPLDAQMVRKIADQPKAIWMGDWSGDITSAVQKVINKTSENNTMPVFVAYNIPGRDCGGYSSGGQVSINGYQNWINNFATGIGNNPATVILEPDALANISCLSPSARQERFTLLQFAIQKLKSQTNTHVYLDAGHAGWIEAADMANRLKEAGIGMADGFSINVSNFDTTASSIVYGKQIATQTDGKHFVIDTSRNGNGPTPDNAWCNPANRALGEKPTTQTGDTFVDAFLWMKYPGESDGNCNGGPSAGTWYAEYALQLARNAKW